MPTRDSDGSESSQHARRYSAKHSTDSAMHAKMDELTRRRLLGLGASASLSSLVAGCGGGGDSPGDTTTVEVDTTTEGDGGGDGEAGDTTVSEEGGETVVQTVVSWNWPANETTMNYNAPSNFPGGYSSTFFFTPMTLYSKQDQQYYPVLLKELPTFDRCFQLHKFEENFTFWDGLEHNAYDQVYGHQANAYACCGGPDEVPWNAQIYNDDRFIYKENKGAAYAPGIAAGNAEKGVRWRRDIFKPIFEEFQEAENDDEVQQAVNKFRGVDLTVDSADEHNAGTSMWKPVSASADTITMEIYEDHPFAGNTNLDRWIIQVAPKLQSELQLINNNKVDIGSTNFEDLSNPPSELETQIDVPGNLGKGMAFNWRRKVPGDRAFRRAMAYLLPTGNIAQAAAQTGLTTREVDQQTTSAPREVVARGTNDGFLDSIIDYGVETRPEQAAETLRNAGYSKAGGEWKDPDGESIQIRMIAQTLAVNSNIGAAISGLMKDFGIPTNFSVLESGTYRQTHSFEEGNFDYDITLTGMLIADSISTLVNESQNAADVDAGTGWLPKVPEECKAATRAPKELKKDVLERTPDGSGFLTSFYGIPLTEEGLFPPIPRTIGQEDLSGETYRPDLARTSLWSSFRFPEEQLREWNTEHLWWCNFHMPKIYLYTNRSSIWMDSQNFALTDGAPVDRMGDHGKFYDSSPDKHPFVTGEMNGT